MNWSEVAARSHARRLQDRGWLARYPMIRGEGCLFTATRTGVTIAGIPASVATPPRIGSWPQHIAVAWTAAWVTLRGRAFHGRRELLLNPDWTVQLHWHDYHGSHQAAHRPSLVVHGENNNIIVIEVMLTRRPAARISAELTQHASWQADGHTHGVIYVYRDSVVRERITRAVRELGFATSALAIGTITSSKMRDQARSELEGRRIKQRNVAASRSAA